MTQGALARELGVHRATIGTWEHGAALPEVWLLRRLADTLETTVAYLIGAQDNPGPATWLTPREAKLLELFRAHDAAGQDAMLEALEMSYRLISRARDIK